MTIVWLLLATIPIGLSLWALLDAARRPAWAWALANRSQLAWLVAILLGALIVPVGLIVSGWYLTRVRPDVQAIEEGRLE